MTISIKEIAYAGVQSAPAQKWPTFDGQNLVRADFVTSSEIGGCARKVWFGKRAEQTVAPAKVDHKDWGFFARGHNVEAWLVEQLRRGECESHELCYMGDEQISFHDGIQSGTPDGVALDRTGHENYVLEFKSIDPRTNITNLPKKQHLAQVHQNMDLVSHCLDIDIVGSWLVYVDCSDYTKFYEFFIDADFAEQERLARRAKDIGKAEKPSEVEAEGMFTGDCRFCAFTASCSENVKAENAASVDASNRQRIARNVFK